VELLALPFIFNKSIWPDLLNYVIKFLHRRSHVVTKGIITSINRAGNRCIVRLPLFETASSTAPVEIEALVSITPGLFNNLFVKDVVFVAFEENALEKPIIIGKLYTGATRESNTAGGAGVFDTLNVRSSANLPAASTNFIFKGDNRGEYNNLKTPKKMADYIKWLEKLFKNMFSQVDADFRCFKNWAQYQLRPENNEIDDGDIDTGYHIADTSKYQSENGECKICGSNCTKNKTRRYTRLDTTKTYPNT
jgi:hypothetical protein